MGDCIWFMYRMGRIHLTRRLDYRSGPIAASIGIVIGALLMILIAVSYGALVERFPVSGARLPLVS